MGIYLFKTNHVRLTLLQKSQYRSPKSEEQYRVSSNKSDDTILRAPTSRRATSASGGIMAVVGPIIPAVQAMRDKGGDHLENSVREIVRRTVAALQASPVLGPEVKAGKLKIVGGRCDLDAGSVELIA